MEISLLKIDRQEGLSCASACTVLFSQTSTSQLQNNLTSKDWHTARILWMSKGFRAPLCQTLPQLFQAHRFTEMEDQGKGRAQKSSNWCTASPPPALDVA